ncbi:MAG: COX aromatic rich motif-containing protein, partial [Betaproteobacteria bacterium]|nr:COX aromatic rich motif-containing protein [Betaproteobacteria bacterium]
PRYFSSVEPQLFERILQKYLPNAEAGQTGRHGMTPAM